MILKRRFPNFVQSEPKDWTEHEVHTYEDLLKIEWIKCMTKAHNHIGLYSSKGDNRDYLMHLFAVKDEIKYLVVGYIFGPSEQLGLTDYKAKLVFGNL